jgi:hypothetical protein
MILSLGATAPPLPSAEAGTKYGAAAKALAAVAFRNRRRERYDVSGMVLLLYGKWQATYTAFHSESSFIEGGRVKQWTAQRRFVDSLACEVGISRFSAEASSVGLKTPVRVCGHSVVCGLSSP